MPERDADQSRLRLRGPAVVDRPNLRLVLLPVAGGIGLVMHILAGISLLVAFVVLVLLGAAIWATVLPKASVSSRRRIARRVQIGVAAGLVATVAYDSVRYGVVALLSLDFKPFHAWSLFGEALLGPAASASATFAIGFGYHLVNGIGFAVAFTVIVQRPTLLAGIAWGLALEFAMALLYPAWMRIAQLQEFLTISVIGHLVYGATLGLVARAFLRRDDAAGRTSTGPPSAGPAGAVVERGGPP